MLLHGHSLHAQYLHSASFTAACQTWVCYMQGRTHCAECTYLRLLLAEQHGQILSAALQGGMESKIGTV